MMRTHPVRPCLGLLAAAAILLMTGCASSDRLLSTWKEPALKKLEFNHIVALALSNDGPTRRLAEGEMARIIGPKAVPSSLVLKDTNLSDVDSVRGQLEQQGFDGAITMRLLDARTSVRQARDPIPSGYYLFWTYYGMAWLPDRPPDFVAADSILQVEVNIYSITSGKLLWTGTTETMQPRLVETLVTDVGNLVRSELQSERLIPKKQGS